MSPNPGYFRELNRGYTQQRWFFVVQGVLFVALGLAALLVPRAAFELVIALLGAALILNGVGNLLLLVRGQVVPHLRPQVIGVVAASFIGALVIGLFPVLALRLVVLIGALLLVLRGLLALFSIASGRDEHHPISHQRWLLATALFSFGLAAFIVFSPLPAADRYALFVGLLAITVGLELILDVRPLAFPTAPEPEEYDGWRAPQGEADALYTRLPDLPRTPPALPHEQYRSWLGIDTARYQRPMVVAPHPDDLEGFSGGLVYCLAHPVVSVVVAGGNKGVWEQRYQEMDVRDYIEVRLDEAREAGRLLGVESILYMGYLDREVVCSDEAIARMRRVFEHFQPDLVISFEYYKWLTPYAHPDHIATAQIVRTVMESYAPEHPVDYLLTATFAPNRFLNITGVRRIKLEALACHTTQAGLNGIIFPIFEKLITRMWGLFTNVQYAEGYRRVLVRGANGAAYGKPS